MASVVRYGVDISTQLVETIDSPSREITYNEDTVHRRYVTHIGAVDTLIPVIGSTGPDYPSHLLDKIAWKKQNADEAMVELTYKMPVDTFISPTPTTLPPDEIEYVGSTVERHVGSHPSYSTLWIGMPKSKHPGTGALIDDPRGTPTTAPTKPGVESYLIPSVVFRRKHYIASGPVIGTGTTGIATRDIPPSESGSNKWLKTSYTARKNQSQGWWEVQEEWTYLPVGTWDTDLYA